MTTPVRVICLAERIDQEDESLQPDGEVSSLELRADNVIVLGEKKKGEEKVESSGGIPLLK